MKEEAIKKYVKDLNALIEEVRELNKKPIMDLGVTMSHDLMLFLFGRFFKHFNFDSIMFWKREGPDAVVMWNGEPLSVEFEVVSKEFEVDHLKNLEKDEKVLVICWKDNWTDRPNNIDVLHLSQFWDVKK